MYQIVIVLLRRFDIMKYVLQIFLGFGAFVFFGFSPQKANAQYAYPPGYVSSGGGQDARSFAGCFPLQGNGTQNSEPLYESRWGAIAITNGAFGTAENWQTEEQASNAALNSCIKNSSNNDC